MQQMARRPFMKITMGQNGAARQEPRKSRFATSKSPVLRPWLMILNPMGLSNEGGSPIPRCPMRSLAAALATLSLVAATAASAETRIFIIANQADGYGVDQCLAKGDRCGASAARSYCQSRDFAQASSYRRVDPDEITGSVPKTAGTCPHGNCDEYVAITCQR